MDAYSNNYEAAPEFSISSVLNRTLSTLLANPAVFIVLALLAMVPGALLSLATAGSTGGSAFVNILDRILGLVIQGAIAYAAFQVLRGEDVTIGDSMSRGLNEVVTLVLIAILTTLGIVVGTILLIVPGIILACMWAIVVPVCVVERRGTMDCLSRSAQLTKGYRLKIFALFLLVGLATFLIAFVIAGLIGFVTGSEGLALLVASLVASLPVAFGAVMVAIVYFDLRAIQEGVSLDSLANVFD